MIKKASLSVLLLTITLLLGGCAVQEAQYSADFFAMDTFMSIKAYGSNAQKAVLESQKYINQLESKISRTKTGSDIVKLNSAQGEAVQVSDDTFWILTAAVKEAQVTDGAFDPTVARLTDLWQIGTEKQHIPKKSEIADALKTVGYHNIALSSDHRVKLKNGAQIDLGGIGKGYAADKVTEIMHNNGVSRAIISLSGNVYVLGEKASGVKWSVGIADPDKKQDYICSIEESDKTVVTSGDYERFFEQNGVRYHHIFDPKTGYPAVTDLRSVTIVTENSAMADAYSTALFIMGYDKAMEFYKAQGGFEAVFVTKDKKVKVTNGLKSAFTFRGDAAGYTYEK